MALTRPTDAIAKQTLIEDLTDDRFSVNNNALVGVFSFNIFAGIFVSTILGAAFFIDLFWPERQESRSVKRAWQVCTLLCCLFTFGSALALSSVLALKPPSLSGVIYGEGGRTPRRFPVDRFAVASACLIWPGWLACIWRRAGSPSTPFLGFLPLRCCSG